MGFVVSRISCFQGLWVSWFHRIRGFEVSWVLLFHGFRGLMVSRLSVVSLIVSWIQGFHSFTGLVVSRVSLVSRFHGRTGSQRVIELESQLV